MLNNAFSVLIDQTKNPEVYAKTVERDYQPWRTFQCPQENVLPSCVSRTVRHWDSKHDIFSCLA